MNEISASSSLVKFVAQPGLCPFVYDDGGRKEAGYSGATGDCACRAIAIVTGKPYEQVYVELIEAAKNEHRGKRKKKISHPRTGVYKATTRKYLQSLGWKWVPIMGIGTGCKVHLRADELPQGKIIVKASRHLVAVIDGVIHDTYDPSRQGTRCVYGYYTKEA